VITKGFLDLLDEHDEYSFPDLKFTRLSNFPYVTIGSLAELISEEKKTSILKLLSKKEHTCCCYTNKLQKRQKPIKFYRHLIKWDFVPGSSESIELLKALQSRGTAGIFQSKMIKSMLEYKFRQVQWLAYVFISLYGVYLLPITFWQNVWLMLGWSIFHIVIEVIQYLNLM